MKKETRNIIIGASVLALLYFLLKKKKSSTLISADIVKPSAKGSVEELQEGDKKEVDLNKVNKVDEKSGFSNANGTYSYQLVTDATNGNASLTGSILTYTPNKDYVGRDTVEYKILDSDGASSNTAMIIFNITAVYDGPMAKEITQTVQEDGTLTMDIATSSSGTSDSGKGSGTSDSGKGSVTSDSGKGSVTSDSGKGSSATDLFKGNNKG